MADRYDGNGTAMRMWGQLARFATVVSFCSMGGSSAASAAEITDPEIGAQYLRQMSTGMYRSFYDVIKPQFETIISSEEKRLLSSIRFEFPKEFNLLTAYATIVDGERVIVISAGNVAMAQYVIEASLLAWMDGIDPTVVGEFIDEITAIAAENTRRSARGESLHAFPTFGEFVGLDAGRITELHETPEFRAAMEANLVSYIAFVVAHELAHHVLGHVEDPTNNLPERRRREGAADSYAMKLIALSGYNPFAPLATMSILASFEGYGAASDLGDHPSAVCRSYDFIVEGLSLVSEDEGFREFLLGHPEGANWLSTLEENLARVSGDAEQECHAE